MSRPRSVALHGAEIVYMEKEPTLENSATMNITKARVSGCDELKHLISTVLQ